MTRGLLIKSSESFTVLFKMNAACCDDPNKADCSHEVKHLREIYDLGKLAEENGAGGETNIGKDHIHGELTGGDLLPAHGHGDGKEGYDG